MAVLTTDRDRDERELQSMMEGLAPSGQLSSGASLGDARGTFGQVGGIAGQAGTTVGAAPPSPSTGAGRPGGGGGFVTADQYGAANRGAVQRLGSNIAGEVGRVGADARFQVDRSAQEFNRLADEGTGRIDDETLGLIGSSPTAITADAGRKNAVLKARDAQYRGPASLEDTDYYTQNVSRALADVAQTKELAGSQEGVDQLSGKVAPGTRSSGARTLDSNLVQSDGQSRAKIAAERQKLDEIDPLLQTRRSEAAITAELGRKTSDQTREKTRGALSGAQDALQKSIDERLSIARSQAAERQRAAQAALQGTRLNESDIRTAGAFGVQADSERDNVRGAFAGEVPEFIDRGAGDTTIGQFFQDLPGYQQRIRGGVDDQTLAALGLSREQFDALTDLAPVGEFARRGAAGTNNVNAESYLEQFAGLQDLGRFASYRDPNAEFQRRNVAQGEDYDRLAALDELAGTQSTYLNPEERGKFDTSDDLIDFDGRSAADEYLGALETLADRTNFTIAGNRKSGGGTFLKKHGPQILSGGILPRGAEFNLQNYQNAVLGSLIGQDAGSGRFNSQLTAEDLEE